MILLLVSCRNEAIVNLEDNHKIYPLITGTDSTTVAPRETNGEAAADPPVKDKQDW